jgi:23S rRNA (guanosine2251-2'-O)-methyltransferase
MSKARYITGLRSVEQLLSRDGSNIVKLFVEYRAANPRVTAVVDQATAKGIDVQSANRARLQQMSGEARHQGVVAEIRRERMLDDAGLRSLVENKLTGEGGGRVLLLILDGIQDPHNLGACLRSADACGVDAVIIPRDRTVKVNATVRKVAAGGAESVPVIEVTNLVRSLKELQQAGVWIYGTSGEASDSLYDHDYRGPIALVMGAEGSGLRRLTMESCDHLVKLPMRGQVESLNVSVATGICLYEILRSRARG